MPIINDVKDICDRLEGRGWRDYFLDATGGELDIIQSSRPKLLAALTAPLSSINRTKPGLEDFHATADRAITGGSPSQSLFYHALASPAVHPTSNGNPSGNSKNYPTLEELDVIENFIYSLVSDRTDLDDTFIAVFAYQYRIASRTPHLRHADVAYSRTGVARIGTSKPNYDARRRSFWVLPKNGSEAICVLPARYAAFLARWAKPGTAGSVQGGHDGANDADYVFPVHKLFSGKECLDGRDISIDFSEYHRNEKLRMTHRLSANEGGLPLPAGFDLTSFPYVRDSTNGGKLTQLSPVGSSVLVVPEPATSLVRTVAQRNSITNKFQIVHFEVPPVRNIVRPGGGLPRNRFAESSLEIPAFGADRLSPEYVNIRHRVDPNGSITQVPTDLNTLSPSAFANAIENGGYFAAHFTDDSCDGCVEAKVTGLGSPVESLPAFSLEVISKPF
ncbi:hypothetical protein [Gimesia sp.]|uniref:hypothetical protein n=1 Tax=Gimesia sp. TaxID=2024833 RepID=UPI000C54D82F|nr:hypothetical protein [Gimesia sp.]MAX39312.1 hypothetical protein [Gimesia sp.]HAH49294.1 hypothetical protein [Planctomycetaceae bacterium]HBL46898.1 hypothetical protein [Planctomycetaceae bacterium]|tara:strand:+ start:27637 stop:28977 length:1341 start_codon:yes stop_codon:yes gene_type:complete